MAVNRTPAHIVNRTGQRPADETARQVADLRQAVQAAPGSNGVEVGPLTFTAGQTATVAHSLGRAPTRVAVRLGVPSSGYVTINTLTATADATKFITVQSQNACGNVYLWIW